jgi:hypothetical protein
VDTHASWFNDPQRTRDRLVLKDGQEILQSVDDSSKGCSRPDVQHDYSSTPLRRKTGNLAEIAIECDERSPLSRAYLEQFLVGDTVKTLVLHGHHIMAACLQELQATVSDVLVKLELHATRSVGTGMMRSRAASAP